MVGGRPTTFDISREEKDKGTWVAHLATATRKARERMMEGGKGGMTGLVLVADEVDLKRICGRDLWEDVYIKGAKRRVRIW